MRLGQKNGLVRQWARRGSRPSQPKDQRDQNDYIFGAICPARGRGAALVMPFANTNAMQAHLHEISLAVAPGAHAILLMDRVGWHTTTELDMPQNITPVLLPPRAPELNPAENIWQYLRQTYLSNRVFEDYDDIVDAACQAWNRLIETPSKITSIGMRAWGDKAIVLFMNSSEPNHFNEESIRLSVAGIGGSDRRPVSSPEDRPLPFDAKAD